MTCTTMRLGCFYIHIDSNTILVLVLGRRSVDFL